MNRLPPVGLSAAIAKCQSTFRLLLLLAGFGLLSASSHAGGVRLFERDEVIPTYLSGPPDPNPMFYFGGNSQGAQGRIYPYPLYDNLTNQKADRKYHLVYLENEYVRIGILPEIGGRVFSAVDKTDNYDFVYHQHVIKPALIGLIGAWISGGIEWNIPHHHRASTFCPVQWRAAANPDGSKTVWVGELEIRQRMRWAVGYTLRPGSSVLECSVRIVNRTPLPQSMLCFANVAVNANTNYQIIFPPSTQWVTFHGKNQFSQWPVSHQHYAGADFTSGVDVSWYKNHFNANSMFAWNYEEDFFAGYDHGKDAGTMSVADHHLVPGKKFWTWGNGARGRMWDKILTDNDGPYIELMTGAYSDNQPDYSWMQPFEERAFTMHWYPFRGIGGVKNANLDAAVNLDGTNGNVTFGFCTTREFPSAVARLTGNGKTIAEEHISINPGKPFLRNLQLPQDQVPHDLRAALMADGRELVGYSPVQYAAQEQPKAVTPVEDPGSITNMEELDLTGLRVEQFHTPGRNATRYWEESLQRDPGDVEANTELGLDALRRANYELAERLFRKALERLTARYTAPKNAEPFYYLGLALKARERNDEAFDAFYKAAWSQEWKSPAFFSLAELACLRSNFPTALDLVQHSLEANALNLRACTLKAAILRHLDRSREAEKLLAEVLPLTDPLDPRLLAEEWLATGSSAAARSLVATLRAHPQNAQEVAAEFLDAGLCGDGQKVLAKYVSSVEPKTVSPLLYYYLGEFAERLGAPGKAAELRTQAIHQPADYVFPFQAEEAGVLRHAMAANPLDPRAPYYLGNLLFDWQPEEAIRLWLKSTELEPTSPMAWRNLAQAFAHRDDEASRTKAIGYLERAVSLGPPSPTRLAELDHLYQAAGVSVEKRLALFERNQAAAVQKDESLADLIGLKICVGKAEEAIGLLQGHTFSIWEGATPFNTGEAWANAHLVRGVQRLRAGEAKGALADFTAASEPPPNLRAEERSWKKVELAYWTGCAHEALGQAGKARQAWTASAGSGKSSQRHGGSRREEAAQVFERYYRGLSLQKLGQQSEARKVFEALLTEGKEALEETANNGERLARSRRAGAHGAQGMGHAGLGEWASARQELALALDLEPDNLDARLAAREVPQ